MLTKQEFLRRHNISMKHKSTRIPLKTAGMSSSGTPSSFLQPHSPAVLRIQFSFIPILRPTNFTPVTTTTQEVAEEEEEEEEEEEDPLRGSFHLIQSRIDLLNNDPTDPRVSLIRREIDDNGELSGKDLAPRGRAKIPEPKPTREENLRRVGTRKPSRDPEDNVRRNLLVNRANRMQRQLRREAAKAAREARGEAKAQEDIARAAAGNLSAEQQAQLDLQEMIQDSRRRTQGITLQDNLTGLGLTLYPDYLASTNNEDPTKTDDEFNEAGTADLETIGPQIRLTNIPNLSALNLRLRPRPNSPASTSFGFLPTPTSPTTSLTRVNIGEAHPCGGPAQTATEALTRAVNGQTEHEWLRASARQAQEGRGGDYEMKDAAEREAESWDD